MRYNKEYYILETDKLRKVKGCDYKDSRMFVYKRDDGFYVLTDKKTGLRVVKAIKLKDIDDRFAVVRDAYERLVAGPTYTTLKQNFAVSLFKGLR